MPANPRRCVILRRIEAADGPAKVTVVLDVRARYGREAMGSLTLADGAWSGQHGDFRFRWSGAARARQHSDGSLVMTVDLAAGARHDLVLELSDLPFDQRPPDPDAAWRATEDLVIDRPRL